MDFGSLFNFDFSSILQGLNPENIVKSVAPQTSAAVSEIMARPESKAALQKISRDLTDPNQYQPTTVADTARNIINNDLTFGNISAPIGTSARDIQAQEIALAGMSSLPGISGPAALTFNAINNPLAISAQQLAGVQDSAFRGNQQALIEALTAQSQGRGGPSPAELLLKQQQDSNLQQAMALAASQSGRALPAAQRQVMNLQAQGAQEALRNAAILRAQEQQQALGQLTGALQGVRGQDQAFAQLVAAQQQAQAAMDLDAARANQAATLDTSKFNAANQFAAAQANAANQLDVSKFNQMTQMDINKANQALNLAMAQANQQAQLEAARTNAANTQAAAQFNVQSMMERERLNAALRQAEEAAKEQQRQRASGELISAKGQEVQWDLGSRNIQAARDAADKQAKSQMVGGLLQAGAAGLGYAATKK